jgi:hypothetical protein
MTVADEGGFVRDFECAWVANGYAMQAALICAADGMLWKWG